MRRPTYPKFPATLQASPSIRPDVGMSVSDATRLAKESFANPDVFGILMGEGPRVPVTGNYYDAIRAQYQVQTSAPSALTNQFVRGIYNTRGGVKSFAAANYSYPSQQMVIGAALAGLSAAPKSAAVVAARKRVLDRAVARVTGQDLAGVRSPYSASLDSPSMDRQRQMARLMGLSGAYATAKTDAENQVAGLIERALKAKLLAAYNGIQSIVDFLYNTSLNQNTYEESPAGLAGYDDQTGQKLPFMAKATIRDSLFESIGLVFLTSKLSLTQSFKDMTGADWDLDAIVNSVLPADSEFKLPWDFSSPRKKNILQWREQFLADLYKYMWGAPITPALSKKVSTALAGKRDVADAITEFLKSDYKPAVKATVKSFTPASGRVDTLITVTGTDMSGTTVNAGGVDVSPISNTGTTLTFKIPAGAQTGPLIIGGIDVGVITVAGSTQTGESGSGDTTGCTSDAGCGAGQQCVSGACKAKKPTEPRAKVGQFCRLLTEPSSGFGRIKPHPLCEDNLNCVGMPGFRRCKAVGGGEDASSNTGLIVGGVAVVAVLFLALRK